MLYWSEILGASVYRNDKNIGNVENLMLHPEEKIIAGFLLERRNRDIRYRYFPYSQIETMKRDRIDLKGSMELKTLTKADGKQYMFCEDFLKKTIQDDKGEWIGRVADFGFDPSNGFVRDMIFSGSFVEDMWIGRKRMPVLYQVEFSREFITIDKETREEITGLNKGLRQWLK